jgi:hypothetical protein
MRRAALPCLLLLAGCGTTSSGDGGSDGGVVDGGRPDGSVITAKDGGAWSLPAKITTNLILGGRLLSPQDTSISAGVTVTLEAGASLQVAPGAQLLVAGTLTTEGVKGNDVAFDAADAGTFGGLTVLDGGWLKLAHATIHHAQIAVRALPGSRYTLTGMTIDSSDQLLLLQSDGVLQYCTLHGEGADQVLSPVVIDHASPVFADVTLDRGNTSVDLVTLDGPDAGPHFDHVEVSQGHCAFHFNTGYNAAITHAFIHDTQYALMVEQSVNSQISASNLTQNAQNIGQCVGGSFVGNGNYVEGDVFDTSCVGQPNNSAAASALSNVGSAPEP